MNFNVKSNKFMIFFTFLCLFVLLNYNEYINYYLGNILRLENFSILGGYNSGTDCPPGCKPPSNRSQGNCIPYNFVKPNLFNQWKNRHYYVGDIQIINESDYSQPGGIYNDLVAEDYISEPGHTPGILVNVTPKDDGGRST